MTTWDYVLAFLLISNAIGIFVTHARRLQDVERKLNLIIAHLGIDSATPITPTSHVVSLAADPQQRIAAIRAYRQQTGAGLKDAMAVIDKIAGESNQSRA
jgi:ribosomal protein L7/L12